MHTTFVSISYSVVFLMQLSAKYQSELQNCMKANDECRRISNEKDTLQDKVMQLNNEVIKLELELKTNHVSFRHACNARL